MVTRQSYDFRTAAALAVLALCCLPAGPIARVGEAAEAASLLEQAKLFESGKQYADAIESYREYLAVQPENDEVRGALARLLAWQDRFEESEQLYKDILTRHPGDREVQTGLARVLSWQKRFPEARVLYETLLHEAPDDVEARRGLGDVLLWSGSPKEALAQYEAVQAVAPNGDVARQVERIKQDLYASPRAPVGLPAGRLRLPYRDYFKAGYSHYSYTKGVPNERDGLFEAAKSFGDKTLIGRIEPLNRFGAHDTPVSAEFYSPLWARAWGYLAGQATINPNFAPNYSVTGEAAQGLGGVHASLAKVELTFGYKRLLYKKDHIDLLTPGINIYLPFDLWITEKIYVVPDTGAITLSSQLTWRPADRVQVSVSGGFGTSGERIVATQDFTRVGSRTVQGGFMFPISEKFSGEAMGYYEDRGALYVRRGGTFNLIYHW